LNFSLNISLDFILKPKHSAFYCTPLDILLNHLDAEKLILVGFAGNICVLFTANDAYMRNFKLIIPSDCIGSNTAEVNSFV
jgi:nicotinamidase-related amidase